MKLHILFEREADIPDVCWAIDAVDEYTVDEWNGAYPDEFAKKLAAVTINERKVLIVEVPENVAEMLWPDPPVVQGTVVEP